MRVVELWRYPVKSLQGEQLTVADIGPNGLEADRHWALVDLRTGHTLTARRAPALLFVSAGIREGALEVRLPDGTVAADDDDLTAWLGHPVALREATEPSPTYESPIDWEDESGSEWKSWEGPAGAFHDSGEARVSLLSTGSLQGWDRRRFRPNVVVDGAGEDALVGCTIAIGEARLQVVTRIARCVMTTRPQPGGIERDLDVLRRVNRERGGRLALGALVPTPGRVRVGDEVIVEPR